MDICPGVGLLDHMVVLLFFKEPPGTSLVIQWLRLCALNAEDTGWALRSHILSSVM